MQVKFNCTYCHAKIGAEDEFCGMTVQCPGCEASISVPSARFGTGAELGGYRIDQFLGNGAMGEVYLATQLSMDRPVALKIISKHVAEDEEDRERFAREIRLLAKLNHQNIVTAFEAGEEDGCQFLAMGFIDGVGLDERLDREKTLSEKDALDICIKVAEALKYAWERFGLLHRDVKPANVMIDRYGEVKLMDMGIAKTASEESSATMTGMVIGTPYYMSPEQARAREDLDFRSDMYGLGATLFHLVTGEYSHTGSNPMEVLTRKLSEPVRLARTVNPDVSEGCEALLAQILEIDAEARPQTWEIVIERMKRVRSGKMPIKSAKTQSVKRRKMRVGVPTAPTLSREEISEVESEVDAVAKKKPILGIVIAIAVALIAAIAAIALLGGGGGEPALPDGGDGGGAPISGTDGTGGAGASPSGIDPDAAAKKAAAEKLAAEEAARQAAVLKKRAASAAKILASAEASYKENPKDLYGAMDAFQRAVSAGEGTPIAKKAYKRVQDLRERRDRKAEHILAFLGYNAYQFVKKDAFDRAAGVMHNYSGAFKSETAGVRSDLAGGLYSDEDPEERKEAIAQTKRYAEMFRTEFKGKRPDLSVIKTSGPDSSTPVVDASEKARKKAIANAIRERWESVSLEVANAVLRSDFAKAQKTLEVEVENSDGFVKGVYAKFLERVKEVSTMSERVLEGLRKDVGNKVTVQFSRGPESFTMQEVSATEIKGYVEVKAGSSVGRLGKRYRITDLSASEYLKRLEMSGTSELAVMRGLLAVRLRRYDVADASFEEAGGILGTSLRKALEPLAPSLKEAAALSALRDMLRDLGVSGMSDPGEIRTKLDVVSLSEARLGEIRATATAMRGKYAETALVREQAPLLDMLCGLSKISWPKSPEKIMVLWDANLPDESVDLATRGDAKIVPGLGIQVGEFGGAIVERKGEGRLMGENGVTFEFYFKRSEKKESAGQLLSFEHDASGVLGVYLKGDDLVIEVTSGGSLREIPMGQVSGDAAHISVAIDQRLGRIRGGVDGQMVLDVEMSLDRGAMKGSKLVLGATRRADRPWAGVIDNVLFYGDAQVKTGFMAHYTAQQMWMQSKKK